MTEAELQKQIMEYLDARGIFHYRQNSGGKRSGGRYVQFGPPGIPDIIGIYRAYYFGVEVKDEKGKQSEKQKEFQEKIEWNGGFYILARDLVDVQLGLSRIDETAKKARDGAETRYFNGLWII